MTQDLSVVKWSNNFTPSMALSSVKCAFYGRDQCPELFMVDVLFPQAVVRCLKQVTTPTLLHLMSITGVLLSSALKVRVIPIHNVNESIQIVSAKSSQ